MLNSHFYSLASGIILAMQLWDTLDVHRCLNHQFHIIADVKSKLQKLDAFMNKIEVGWILIPRVRYN